MSEKVSRFIAAIEGGYYTTMDIVVTLSPFFGYMVKDKYKQHIAELLEYSNQNDLDTEVFGVSVRNGVCNLMGGSNLFPMTYLRPITKKDLPELKKRYRAYLEEVR